MSSEYDNIIVTLKPKDDDFSSLCSQYNALDKAILKLGSDFVDISALEQLQLSLKDKILLLLVKNEKEKNELKNEKSLSM